ncbi:MAG TPA: hypothetical protein P5522_12515 [Spirochaetia bacterium]|nr:hypothetical protein [Spirochaetia bacterium]
MNKEFHFNTVYILAREAGFTEADSFTLAGSSQFVDEAVFNLQFSLPDEEMQFIITQSYQFWDDITQKNIYLPFHFIPGNIKEPFTQLKNNSINPYCVIANGTLAKEALITSLEQRDIFLIGIALHGFADTWAHQYFSGKHEQWNANSESNVLMLQNRQLVTCNLAHSLIPAELFGRITAYTNLHVTILNDFAKLQKKFTDI